MTLDDMGVSSDRTGHDGELGDRQVRHDAGHDGLPVGRDVKPQELAPGMGDDGAQSSIAARLGEDGAGGGDVVERGR